MDTLRFNGSLPYSLMNSILKQSRGKAITRKKKNKDLNLSNW